MPLFHTLPILRTRRAEEAFAAPGATTLPVGGDPRADARSADARSPVPRRGAARRLARAAALGLACVAALAQPAAAGGFVRDAEVEATLKRLSDPLFRAAGLPVNSIEIRIFDDRQPNAFVYGGRNMVVSTGLLRDYADPDQLMGVIAHEAGHITGGHLARRQIAVNNLKGPAMAALLLGIAAAAAAGAAGGGSSAGAGVAMGAGAQDAYRKALLAFTRSEESAADQAGLTYLERAGVSPMGMEEVLQSFRGQEVFSNRYVDPYALTHPVSAERLSAIDRRATASPWRDKKPDAELVYWVDRMHAKLDGFLDTPSNTLRRLDPNDRSEFATLRRAIALHRAPDPDKAAAEADRLIQIRPNDPYYYELKGQILLESGRGPAAVAPYRKAVALAPDEPLILGYLGRALLSVGQPDSDREALAALERGAERSDGGDPDLLRDLAYAYARTGQEGRAALTSAERMMLIGAPRDAHRMALRAKGLLPAGSPAWLRADDIIASAEVMLK